MNGRFVCTGYVQHAKMCTKQSEDNLSVRVFPPFRKLTRSGQARIESSTMSRCITDH